MRDIAPRRTLTVVEHTDLSIAADEDGSFNVTLRGPRQQRYRLQMSTDFVSWSATEFLTVTNSDGATSFRYTPAPNQPQGFIRVTAE
jgi:hypothetical protein